MKIRMVFTPCGVVWCVLSRYAPLSDAHFLFLQYFFFASRATPAISGTDRCGGFFAAAHTTVNALRVYAVTFIGIDTIYMVSIGAYIGDHKNHK